MISFHRKAYPLVSITIVLMFMTAVIVNAQDGFDVFKKWCESKGGVALKTKDGSRCEWRPPPGSTTSPSDNGESARREEERRKAEQAAAEEAERKRREAEAKAKREAEERQKQFEKERDDALMELRGTGKPLDDQLTGTGTNIDDTRLRGSGEQTDQLRNVTSSGDPMIVDARNVDSGLPKSVDGTIPKTPAGNNVRKGFIAIQNGNWKAALAWFKVALSKEPRNAGLRRLADLAEFTLYFRTHPTKEEPALQNVPATGRSTDRGTIKSPEEELRTNPTVRVLAANMAARKRADLAYKKYDEKYGEPNTLRGQLARNKAGQAAYNGKGYTDAELKQQLLEGLLEYRRLQKLNIKKYGEKFRDSAGGDATAEEIILGGKG